MSSPFDPELLEKVRRRGAGRQLVTLFDIEFPDAPGGPVTLRASNKDLGRALPVTGEIYERGANGDPIRATISQLSGGPSPCTATVRVLNRRWAVLGDLTVFESLPTWRWQGAIVTIYLWERSVSDGAKKGQLFRGTVDSFTLTRDADSPQAIVLNCIQPRDWNKPTPEKLIDTSTQPNAPDGVKGQPEPEIYGDWNDYAMRSPWTTAYTSKQKQQDAGAGRGVVPLMLVDPGTGAATVKLLAACHGMADLLDRSSGYTVYIAAGDVLAPVDTAGLTEHFGTDESYLTLDDDKLVAYYGLRPIDVRTGTNNAQNPRRAMDPFDETSFATIDQAAGAGVLCLQLPSGVDFGRAEAADVLMAFVGDAANTHQIRAYPYNPVAGTNGTATGQTATNTTPNLYEKPWDSAWWGPTWLFAGFPSSSPDRTLIDVRVDFAGGTTNKAKILWVVIRVKFRPNRSLVTPAYARAGLPYVIDPRRIDTPILPPALRPETGVSIAASFLVEAQFFANLKGQKDDGSGTITGTPNALLTAAPDIVRRFLERRGQTNFATDYDPDDPTVGFGSFVKARDVLRRGTPAPPQLAAWIGGSQVGAMDVVTKMGEQSLSCVLLDRFTDQWMFHPWLAGASADYDLELDAEDLPDLFEAEVTSDVDLQQGFRVQYGFDHFKGTSQFEAFCTPSSSGPGQSQPTWRDQKPITIDATNKYVDFKRQGTTVNATMALATYNRPETLATALETAINAALLAIGGKVWCGHSWTIVAGVNDDLPIESMDSAGAYSILANVTIPEGIWRAPNALAAALTTALNAAGVVAYDFLTPVTLQFRVSYTWSTGKFRVEVLNPPTTPGYEDCIRIPLVVSGSDRSIASGWAALGWDAEYVRQQRGGGTDLTKGSILTPPIPRYRERYYVVFQTVAATGYSGQLLWATGANTANNCAFELGWDKADVTFGPGAYSTYQREMRELIAADSQEQYGPKLPGTLQADWVHDENSALMLRDGSFDFTNLPRVTLRARTHVCPDLQRFRVLSLRASCDRIRPYPKFGSDGSWAGKPMRVLEVEQEIDSSYHVEFFAQDA